MNINRIEGEYMKEFIDDYLENEQTNGLKLENLSLSQNFLRDDGVSDLIERVHRLSCLKSLNLNANKCTELILDNIV